MCRHPHSSVPPSVITLPGCRQVPCVQGVSIFSDNASINKHKTFKLHTQYKRLLPFLVWWPSWQLLISFESGTPGWRRIRYQLKGNQCYLSKGIVLKQIKSLTLGVSACLQHWGALLWGWQCFFPLLVQRGVELPERKQAGNKETCEAFSSKNVFLCFLCLNPNNTDT